MTCVRRSWAKVQAAAVTVGCSLWKQPVCQSHRKRHLRGGFFPREGDSRGDGGVSAPWLGQSTVP